MIDGDTFSAKEVDLGMDISIRGVHFRLIGINTPEKNQEGYKEATEYTAQQIEGKEVLVTSFGKDKYGRWLVNVHLEDGQTLNKALVEKGLAKEYMGGLIDG